MYARHLLPNYQFYYCDINHGFSIELIKFSSFSTLILNILV
ncbi:hypothetical protein XBJ2_1220015 [Xenorhabdus bovienii str. Jollieti]|uniref:Uncharacterized protein n=1 Tax=Xenorhabdus bovienii (strain SS-2004) TaxID=406818 RepID=D3V141_XENBS|nr:hypothetical protein XBJ1_2188 [Xenorhabdus bovienii SS-2004]CDH27106.1 hypothetical protein XBJ2_1220015 [Xenorhabdus bovienii str. Jollieti]